MLLPISYRVGKKGETIETSWETKQGGDRIGLSGDCCWKFIERCSSLCFPLFLYGKLASWKQRLCVSNARSFSFQLAVLCCQSFNKRLNGGVR